MNRRDFCSTIGKTAPMAMVMGSYLPAYAARNTRYLVATPGNREEYLKKMLRILCNDIGPHRVGTPEYDKVALLIKKEMELSLPLVEQDFFHFTFCEFLNEPEFWVGEKWLETYASKGCASTPIGGVMGVLKKKVGRFPYGVMDKNTGKLLAHVTVSQYGRCVCSSAYRTDKEIAYVDPERPLPSRFNIGKQDVHILEDAVKNQTPVRVNIQTKFIPNKLSSSIVGTLPGESQEEILVLAHADSPHDSPGANDNMASVIVMIMLAHARSGTKPRRTLTIVATGGEEDGKLGAIHYAEKRKKEGTLQNIKFILHFDSLTYGPNMQIYSKDEQLKSIIMAIDRDLNVKATPKLFDRDGYLLDALPFRESGARAMAVNSRGYDERTLHLWHRPSDLAENVPLDCGEIGFLIFDEYINRLQTL